MISVPQESGHSQENGSLARPGGPSLWSPLDSESFPIYRVVSIGRRNTQAEPDLHWKQRSNRSL